MAHPQTEAILKRIQDDLDAHGVTEYLLALRDPDSANDVLRYKGSVFWRIGVGVDIVEDGKAERENDREIEDALDE